MAVVLQEEQWGQWGQWAALHRLCGSGCQPLCAILLFLFNRLAMLTGHRPYLLGLLGKFRSPKKESANCEVLAYLYDRLHEGA